MFKVWIQGAIVLDVSQCQEVICTGSECRTVEMIFTGKHSGFCGDVPDGVASGAKECCEARVIRFCIFCEERSLIFADEANAQENVEAGVVIGGWVLVEGMVVHGVGVFFEGHA